MLNKISLDSSFTSAIIPLDDEKPYLKLIKFKFVPDDIIENGDKYQKIGLKYIKRVKPGVRLESGDVEINEPSLYTLIDPEQKTSETFINQILNSANDFNFSEVEFILENAPPDVVVELWYETEELIPFEEASKGFKQHLEQKGNTKILFSGAFGTGKTTFLKEYFNVNTCYEVFHLYPVNYSVATNEDIFRYIKTELLFLLLEKGVEFDQERFKRTSTAPAFIKENAFKILLPFTRLIPQVGKNVHDILNDLMELKSSFESYEEELQIDDEKEAKKFIKKIYEEEGSIFEDNFYTQLIRQLLEKIKLEGKQTVLIIDDLDRIDPEHIFRILNVFAANVDGQGLYGECTNKFGFDKVLIVCHYENLKRIFRHRYGVETDFSGYIDKYFSRSKFEFDSKEVSLTIVNKLFEKTNNNGIKLFGAVLTSMINDDNLTLRELIKLSSLNFDNLRENSFLLCFFVVDHLCKVADIDSVIQRFNQIKDSSVLNDNSIYWKNYDYMFFVVLASFLFYDKSIHDNNTATYFHTENKVLIKLIPSFSPFEGIQYNPELKDSEGNEFKGKFTRRDCFELVEKIAIEYKKKNGLRWIKINKANN